MTRNLRESEEAGARVKAVTPWEEDKKAKKPENDRLSHEILFEAKSR